MKERYGAVTYLLGHGPLTRDVKLRVAHAPGMPGTFSPPTRVNDPDMQHGTCITHVPWCMPGSLTSGFPWSWWRGKRSQHAWRMRNPQFYVFGKRPINGIPPYGLLGWRLALPHKIIQYEDSHCWEANSHSRNNITTRNYDSVKPDSGFRLDKNNHDIIFDKWQTCSRHPQIPICHDMVLQSNVSIATN